jgi:PAS domain S-box-containing protein
LVNNENQIDFVNQSFSELFDLEELPANLLGMSAAEMRTITPGVFDDPQAALVRIQKIITQDQIISNEQVSIRGKRTYLRDYIPLVVEGKKYGRLWHYLDITESKRAEEKLKESEERFKALHNASFGGITIHDKGLILECNQGLSQITGYPVEELIGMDGLLLIAPSSRELVMNNILAGYEKPYEALGVRKNGEEYPLRLEARVIPYQGRSVRTVDSETSLNISSMRQRRRECSSSWPRRRRWSPWAGWLVAWPTTSTTCWG